MIQIFAIIVILSYLFIIKLIKFFRNIYKKEEEKDENKKDN